MSAAEPVRVYLGIGSNIDAETNVALALEKLAGHFGEMDVSPRFQNPAVGFVGDDFLNLIVGFYYRGSIAEILQLLSDIEYQCGRRRELERGMGSRSLDLDLLTFGDLIGSHQGVTLPRPDVYTRKFVWHPLLNLIEGLEQPTDFELNLKQGIRLRVSTEQSPTN